MLSFGVFGSMVWIDSSALSNASRPANCGRLVRRRRAAVLPALLMSWGTSLAV
jgi:hypothetical protein